MSTELITTISLAQFVKQTAVATDAFSTRPRITCVSGLNLSIQGSEGAYSSPRLRNSETYSSMEVGFPSEPIDLITEYAEDSSDLTGTVYPYVPFYILEQVIDDNGGIVVE